MFYQSQLPIYTVQGPTIQGPPVYFNQLQEEYPQAYAVDQQSVQEQSLKDSSSSKCHRFTPYRWFLYILTLVFLLIAFGILIAVICRTNAANNSQQVFARNQGILRSVYKNQNTKPIIQLFLADVCLNTTGTNRLDLYNFPASKEPLNLDAALRSSPYIDGKILCAQRDNSYVLSDGDCPNAAPNRVGYKACSASNLLPITRVTLEATNGSAHKLEVFRIPSDQPIVDLELFQNGRPCADSSVAPKLVGTPVLTNVNVDFVGCSVDQQKTHYTRVENFHIQSNKYFSELVKLNVSYNASINAYPKINEQGDKETLHLYSEKRVEVPLTKACHNFHETLSETYDQQTLNDQAEYHFNVKVFAAVALAFACLGLLLWVVFVVLRRKLRKLYLVVYVVAAIVAAIIIILGIWFLSYRKHSSVFSDPATVRQIRDAGCLDNFGQAYKESVNNLLRHSASCNLGRLIIALFAIGIIYLVILVIGLIIARKY